ncbi:MAG: glucosaminidase domain-containing protein [Eggerthellaceae bacterium]|nr:glucosaminidase domain-containing protein [Eggerthellaceae bacterium]
MFGMIFEAKKHLHSAWALALSFATVLVLSFGAFQLAFADEVVLMTSLQERVDSTQQEVERTSTEYNDASAQASEARTKAEDARARVKELEAQIAESQEIIDSSAEKLEIQKKRSSDALLLQYKIEAEGFNLTDLMVSSSTVSEFFSTLDYMDHIQELNSTEIKKYTALKDEYSKALETQRAAKAEADEQKALAEEEEARAIEEEARATQALEEAKEARVKAQEEAEAEIARRAQEYENAPDLNESVDWSVGREEFIKEWTERIDAYLAGYPMEGCGAAFAEASWDYGVDPRWSPAIACVESGKGRAVPYYTSNNAWGWFANATQYRTFASFEEGVRLHVEYLARFYGYTITLEHAAVYCPPGDIWYEAVVREMNNI